MHQVSHYRTTVLVSYAVNILSGILKVFGCLPNFLNLCPYDQRHEKTNVVVSDQV